MSKKEKKLNELKKKYMKKLDDVFYGGIFENKHFESLAKKLGVKTNELIGVYCQIEEVVGAIRKKDMRLFGSVTDNYKKEKSFLKL